MLAQIVRGNSARFTSASQAAAYQAFMRKEAAMAKPPVQLFLQFILYTDISIIRQILGQIGTRSSLLYTTLEVYSAKGIKKPLPEAGSGFGRLKLKRLWAARDGLCHVLVRHFLLKLLQGIGVRAVVGPSRRVGGAIEVPAAFHLGGA